MSFLRKATFISIAFSLLSMMAVYGHESEARQPFERPHAHDTLEFHAHLGWDSRYFSEGRDALDGDSLLSTSIEFGWKHFSGGIWYGNSPDQRYDELQVSLAFTQCIGDKFEYYLAYTHLQFPFEDAHDDELSIGFTLSGLPCDFELSTDITYSFEADGYFAEIAASKEFEVSEPLTLSLSGIFGINEGYVSDGHDGANHFALQLGLEYALSDKVSVVAHTTYSWALDEDSSAPGDDQLVDFFHGGIGLQWSF